jgi:hypothetical protein
VQFATKSAFTRTLGFGLLFSMREYYRRNFQTDLAQFVPQADAPYFGHGWDQSCPGLERVVPSRRAQFLVCLYFTVLVDQAMYANFRWLYPRFEELTRYPKFCHGLGQFHRNPRELLDTPADTGLVTAAALAEAIPEGMRLFVDELIDFSERHMPELEPAYFFQTLLDDPDVQIPLLIPILEPSIRQQPAWILTKICGVRLRPNFRR